MFLHLYDAIIDNESMEMTCGDDNDAVQGFSTPEKVVIEETPAKVPASFTDAINKVEAAEPLKQDATLIDSNQTTSVSNEDDLPTSTTDKIDKRGNPDAQTSVMSCKVALNNSEPISTIPKYLTSTAFNFLSSSLSMDEFSSSIGFIADDDHDEPPDWTKKIHTGVNTSLLEALHSNETSLFDSSSIHTPIDNYQETTMATDDSVKEKGCDYVEHDVIEKLGLMLTPPCAPQSIKVDDLLVVANSETIEIDETGKIIGNEDNFSDNSINNDTHTVRSPPRDIYLTYKIDGNRSEVHDETSLSPSQDSNAVNTSTHTPKQNSGFKSFLTPKWGRKMRIFSGIEDKNDGARIGMKKRNNVWDSPGAATIATTRTSPSDGSSFEDDSNFE